LSVTIENARVVAVLRCIGRIVVGDEADILRRPACPRRTGGQADCDT